MYDAPKLWQVLTFFGSSRDVYASSVPQVNLPSKTWQHSLAFGVGASPLGGSNIVEQGPTKHILHEEASF